MKNTNSKEQQLNQVLEQVEVDQSIKEKLAESRKIALDSLDDSSLGFSLGDYWKPVTAVLSVSIIALMVFINSPNPNMIEPMELSTIEILTAEDSLELYQDLEFYMGLESMLVS